MGKGKDGNIQYNKTDNTHESIENPPFHHHISSLHSLKLPGYYDISMNYFFYPSCLGLQITVGVLPEAG
jgi:hypothetical protein